jgi:TIR domain
MLSGMSGMGAEDHVFVSYVREDSDRVDRLQSALERAGLTVWRDTKDLRPGVFWEAEIRKAVITRSLAFVACFSQNTELRRTTFQNEELLTAVEHMRRLTPGTTWLIPVRFTDCAIPYFPLVLQP